MDVARPSFNGVMIARDFDSCPLRDSGPARARRRRRGRGAVEPVSGRRSVAWPRLAAHALSRSHRPGHPSARRVPGREATHEGRAELDRAFADPEAKAIIAVRGGYGATRIACDLAWETFARRPRWIVGFSDVTALHAMAWKAGVASVHGPNVTGLRGPAGSARSRRVASLRSNVRRRRECGAGFVSFTAEKARRAGGRTGRSSAGICRSCTPWRPRAMLAIPCGERSWQRSKT